MQLGYKSLNFNYRGEELFKNFALDIEIEKFTTFLGPSGCGKSTLLKLISGIEDGSETPFKGGFKDLLSKSGKIGFVFQEPHLLPWLTVLENVLVPLRITGSGSQDKALYWLKSLGLEQNLGLHPHELSGGMKMRVSIARALAAEPELILMDEPFSALDESTRFLLQEKVRSLFEETKKTVLFVTHSKSEAVFLSDRIVGIGRRPVEVLFDFKIKAEQKRNLDFRLSEAYLNLQKELNRYA